MFDCPHCGNQLPDGAAFCNQCWRPVDDPPAGAARAGEPEPAATAGYEPVQGDLPTFTPAPGGPPPPEGDDVTSAYPPVPPPQPPSPWATGSPTAAPGWGAPAPAPWEQPPPAPSSWGQPPGAYDPYGYAAPPPGGYGAAPGPYGPAPGYPAPPGPYGYPQPYYGYPPPAGPGTNGMAIAALVSALAGLLVSCGLLSPLGIIFGHIALSQIKRTGESGRGMAIAGLVIGYLSLAGIALMVISIVASSP